MDYNSYGIRRLGVAEVLTCFDSLAEAENSARAYRNAGTSVEVVKIVVVSVYAARTMQVTGE